MIRCVTVLLWLLALPVNAQLLQKMDVRITCSNRATALTFMRVTNFYNDASDRFSTDNRHIGLTLVSNAVNSFTVSGTLVLNDTNKLGLIWNHALTNARPAQTTGFVEFHRCIREGHQARSNWLGCVDDPRANYRRLTW